MCRTIEAALENIAGWLAVDALLQAGDRTLDEVSASTEPPVKPERASAFRSTAAVVEMASSLATGAIALLQASNWYCASALIRQLIETEYLILFSIDFAEAARWEQASPEEIRKSFTQHRMRVIGGFDHQEYWRHCGMGGHPTPQGRTLLRYSLSADFAGLAAALWGDLAQHLQRIWLTTDELLVREHARYLTVRDAQRQAVFDALEPWWNDDPVAFDVPWSPVGTSDTDVPSLSDES